MSRKGILIVYPRDIEILVYLAKKKKALVEEIQRDLLNEPSLPHVYDILNNLVLKGLLDKDKIEVKAKAGRKYRIIYSITRKGEIMLQELKEMLREI